MHSVVLEELQVGGYKPTSCNTHPIIQCMYRAYKCSSDQFICYRRGVDSRMLPHIYARRVFGCTEPKLTQRTRASIKKNQQTGQVYVNVLFLDIKIFCNEIISYNNYAYNKVFSQIFIVIKLIVNREYDCFIDLSQICFDFRNQITYILLQ